MQSDPWPFRPVLFASLGAASAFIVHMLTGGLTEDHPGFSRRLALTMAVSAFSVTLFMVLRRSRPVSGLLFAVIVSLVMGGIVYWRLAIDWPHPFSFMALVTALFICAPFYQTVLHSKWNDYRSLHHHAWGNAVTLPLGLFFVGLTFAVAFLLAQLFSLVGIELLTELLRQDLALWTMAGTAFGASIGVLREYEGIIASTQQLVQSVFSLLAFPLALGLGFFLLVLPFTGLEPLWNNTSNTSATLFSCALAALVFLNAVVRDDADNQSRNRVMQIAARVLAFCLAPLALITGLAVKLRVEQYGWTPDRLWACVICLLVVGYGLCYLVAGLQSMTFNNAVRRSNIYLAVVLCVVAVLLATPVFDFGEYSARDQIARLEDGRTGEDKFDLGAMAFDFGPAGRVALAQLKSQASEELALRIDEALALKSRSVAMLIDDDLRPDFAESIKVLNGPEVLPLELIHEINRNQACRHHYCYVYWSGEESDVLLVHQECPGSVAYCRPEVQLYRFLHNRWLRDYSSDDPIAHQYNRLDETVRPATVEAFMKMMDSAAMAGKLELRPVQRNQIFIDGVSLGPAVR